MAARPAVSVVVITYNDAARLPRAVRSLCAPQKTSATWRSSIVDDASTDDADDVAGRFPGARALHPARPELEAASPPPRNVELAWTRRVPRTSCSWTATTSCRDTACKAPHGRDRADRRRLRVGPDHARLRVRRPGRALPAALFTPRRVVEEDVTCAPSRALHIYLDGFATNKIYDVEFLRRSEELRFREDSATRARTPHYEDHVFTAELYSRIGKFAGGAPGPPTVGIGPRARAGRSSLSLRDVANVQGRGSRTAAESADQALRDAGMGRDQSAVASSASSSRTCGST